MGDCTSYCTGLGAALKTVSRLLIVVLAGIRRKLQKMEEHVEKKIHLIAGTDAVTSAVTLA
jgi:hypothetical protein